MDVIEAANSFFGQEFVQTCGLRLIWAFDRRDYFFVSDGDIVVFVFFWLGRDGCRCRGRVSRGFGCGRLGRDDIGSRHGGRSLLDGWSDSLGRGRLWSVRRGVRVRYEVFDSIGHSVITGLSGGRSCCLVCYWCGFRLWRLGRGGRRLRILIHKTFDLRFDCRFFVGRGLCARRCVLGIRRGGC